MTYFTASLLILVIPIAMFGVLVCLCRMSDIRNALYKRAVQGRVRARLRLTQLEVEEGLAVAPARSTDKRCSACGSRRTIEGAFCDVCGVKVKEVTRKSDALACRECGEVNALTASYCHICGRSLYYYTREDRQPVL